MAPSHAWLPAMRRYLAVIAVSNLVWETAQMPLCTLWRTGSMQDIAFAVVHCTGGDVLIAAVSLFGSLLLFGAADWPRSRFLPVAAATVVLGLGYTIYSEHVNTASNAWAYSDLMPVLPGLGTGLAPLAQWLVVPLLAFAAVRPPLRTEKDMVQASLGLDPPLMGDTAPRVAPDHLARRPQRGHLPLLLLRLPVEVCRGSTEVCVSACGGPRRREDRHGPSE